MGGKKTMTFKKWFTDVISYKNSVFTVDALEQAFEAGQAAFAKKYIDVWDSHHESHYRAVVSHNQTWHHRYAMKLLDEARNIEVSTNDN